MIYPSELTELICETVPVFLVDAATGYIIFARRPLELLFRHYVKDVLSSPPRPIETLFPIGVREALTSPELWTNPLFVNGRTHDGQMIPVAIQLAAGMFDDRRCVLGVVTDLSRHSAVTGDT